MGKASESFEGDISWQLMSKTVQSTIFVWSTYFKEKDGNQCKNSVCFIDLPIWNIVKPQESLYDYWLEFL